MKKINLPKTMSKGFTLVELLVVIAVIGILAAVVLIAMDPGEQMARGRDSSRKMSISQLGRAVQNYYTSQNSSYPVTGVSWITNLTAKGELKSVPSQYEITGLQPGGCTTNAHNGYCYVTSAGDFVVYNRLESKKESANCSGVASNTWFVWSSTDGRAGVVCGSTDPTPGAQTFK